MGSSSGNIITSHELKVVDTDSGPEDLKFVVRSPPQYGRLQTAANPGVAVSTFTQGNHHFFHHLFLILVLRVCIY